MVVLDSPRIQNASRNASADKGTLFLRPDNTVDRILASGNVRVESQEPSSAKVQSNQLELLMLERQDTLRNATFSGDVRMENSGTQPMQGSAGRVVLNFTGKNVLSTVQAKDNVRFCSDSTRKARDSGRSSEAQDVEVTASAIDFVLAGGRRLRASRHLRSRPRSPLRPIAPATGQTLITAGKFQARFDDLGQLASVHGAPTLASCRKSPGQPDRVSTSTMLDASFHPGGGIDSIMQQGSVAYRMASARPGVNVPRYTPADQILVLSGSPRIVDGGMTTTARSMRMNRATGDAFADGDVKSTYSDLKPQPDGALLASSDPHSCDLREQ